MATLFNYNDEFRQKVLKDFKEGHPIEKLVEQFSVPAVVIKNWIDMDKVESYLDAYFLEEKPSHYSRWDKLKFVIDKIIDFLKEYVSYAIFIAGIIIVIFLCFFFKSDTEFVPSEDPVYDMASQVDSVSIRCLRIESLLERHEETINDISNTASDISVNQEHRSEQLKTLIRKFSDIENLCKESLDTCEYSK